MNQRDKDFRYMAISDLLTELGKENFKLDAESERKIVTKLLDIVATDSSSDVQGIAVKWYPPISPLRFR
jgi:cullin-associated NEDD8-dissociated protein 1